jgi:hypothetical protein
MSVWCDLCACRRYHRVAWALLFALQDPPSSEIAIKNPRAAPEGHGSITNIPITVERSCWRWRLGPNDPGVGQLVLQRAPETVRMECRRFRRTFGVRTDDPPTVG